MKNPEKLWLVFLKNKSNNISQQFRIGLLFGKTLCFTLFFLWTQHCGYFVFRRIFFFIQIYPDFSCFGLFPANPLTFLRNGQFIHHQLNVSLSFKSSDRKWLQTIIYASLYRVKTRKRSNTDWFIQNNGVVNGCWPNWYWYNSIGGEAHERNDFCTPARIMSHQRNGNWC